MKGIPAAEVYLSKEILAPEVSSLSQVISFKVRRKQHNEKNIFNNSIHVDKSLFRKLHFQIADNTSSLSKWVQQKCNKPIHFFFQQKRTIFVL